MNEKTLKKRSKKAAKLEKKLKKNLQKVQKIRRKLSKVVASVSEASSKKANNATTKKNHSSLSKRSIRHHSAINTKYNIDIRDVNGPIDLDKNDLNAVYRPYKSSPCKKCPALGGGMCKCALKRINKIA